MRRKTVSHIRKTESDPKNAYSVLIQRELDVLQKMDQGKTRRQKNKVNIGSCNENRVGQRVSSANVRGVEIKSSTDKKAKHDTCLLLEVLVSFGDFQRDVTLKIGSDLKFSVHLPKS